MADIITVDERAPLQRMRRTHLLMLCEDMEIPLKEEFPKDRLIVLLMGAGVDPNKPPAIKMPRPEIKEPETDKTLTLKKAG